MRRKAGGPAEQAIRVGKRVVGHVIGDTFFKHVRASVHFLREPRAICFDVASLRDAEQAGAVFVNVTDDETGTCYRAAMGTVWARGWALDRGFGAQWALALGQWARGEEPVGQQLVLFGAAV